MTYYITPEQYEIAEANGISYNTLYKRVYELGWKPEVACEKELVKHREGLWSKWKHLALHNNITQRQFYDRVRDNNKYMSCYEAATRPIKRRVNK